MVPGQSPGRVIPACAHPAPRARPSAPCPQQGELRSISVSSEFLSPAPLEPHATPRSDVCAASSLLRAYTRSPPVHTPSAPPPTPPPHHTPPPPHSTPLHPPTPSHPPTPPPPSSRCILLLPHSRPSAISDADFAGERRANLRQNHSLPPAGGRGQNNGRVSVASSATLTSGVAGRYATALFEIAKDQAARRGRARHPDARGRARRQRRLPRDPRLARSSPARSRARRSPPSPPPMGLGTDRHQHPRPDGAEPPPLRRPRPHRPGQGADRRRARRGHRRGHLRQAADQGAGRGAGRHAEDRASARTSRSTPPSTRP